MQIPNDRDLVLALRRLARWERSAIRRTPLAEALPARPLSPLDVDEAASSELRRNVRRWPDRTEAPNRYVVSVGREDWDDYWGVDQDRKAREVSSYLGREAQARGITLPGTAQVSFELDGSVTRGTCRVASSFAEVQEPSPRQEPRARQEARPRPAAAAPRDERPQGQPAAVRPSHMSDATTVLDASAWDMDGDGPDATPADAGITAAIADATPVAAPAAEAGAARERTVLLSDDAAALVDDGGFRMVVRPGDVVGAVRSGELVPSNVNLRLDGRGFPGVEPCHLGFGLTPEGWTVTNFASGGTRIRTRGGQQLHYVDTRPHRIADGDTIYMGPDRPLRFMAGGR